MRETIAAVIMFCLIGVGIVAGPTILGNYIAYRMQKDKPIITTVVTDASGMTTTQRVYITSFAAWNTSRNSTTALR